MVDRENGVINRDKYIAALISLGVYPEIANAMATPSHIGNLEYIIDRTSWELKTLKRLNQIYPDLNISSDLKDLEKYELFAVSYAKEGQYTYCFQRNEDKTHFYIHYNPQSEEDKYMIRSSPYMWSTDRLDDEIFLPEQILSENVAPVDVRSQEGIGLLCIMLIRNAGKTFSDSEDPGQVAYREGRDNRYYFDLQEAIDNLPPASSIYSEASSLA